MLQPMARNVVLLPWFGFLRNLIFWQATWFLFMQAKLSAAEAILLYVLYDVATTMLEVPSGWASDRLGRRVTLIFAACVGCAGMMCLAVGQGFMAFAIAQILLGCHAAFISGTDQALLYESLAADGRADDIEAQQVRLWRFDFAALACSAVMGGIMALWWDRLPFVASSVALLVLTGLAFRMSEPPHQRIAEKGLLRIETLRPAFRNPVLLWLFGVGTVMYGFSHIPFVFGQPFILDALSGLGLDGQAAVISGTVTSVMMLLSVGVSLAAPALRQRLGLGFVVMIAFGLQVFLVGILALTNAPWAIAFLFLRMVPDSLSTPFIHARIQPLLKDETRATFMSLKSFCGRLLFAVTLYFAAGQASDVGAMSFPEISRILGWYAFGGVVLLAGFGITVRLARDDAPR